MTVRIWIPPSNQGWGGGLEHKSKSGFPSGSQNWIASNTTVFSTSQPILFIISIISHLLSPLPCSSSTSFPQNDQTLPSSHALSPCFFRMCLVVVQLRFELRSSIDAQYRLRSVGFTTSCKNISPVYLRESETESQRAVRPNVFVVKKDNILYHLRHFAFPNNDAI